MAAINKYSFLRWYTLNDIVDDLQFPMLNTELKQPACIFMAVGEQTKFLINTGITNDIDEIFLINASTFAKIGTSIGTITKIDSTDYCYCEVTNPNVNVGSYRLGLSFDGLIILISNTIFVPRSDFEKYSSTLKYKHNTDFYQFAYSGNTSYYNQFRLPIIEVDRQPDYQIDQYRESTTDLIKNYKGKMFYWIKFNSLYKDKQFDDALSVVLSHDTIIINDEYLTFKTGVKIDENSSSFEMWLDSFVTDKTAETSTTVAITIYSETRTVTFTRNNCEVGCVPSHIDYTKTYTSYISQQDAIDKKNADNAVFQTEGQAEANLYGDCDCPPPIEYTATRTTSKFKGNCPPNRYPDIATSFTKIYTSEISQDDANNIADANIDADAQAYADANTIYPCELVPYRVSDILNTDGTPYYITNSGGAASDQYASFVGQIIYGDFFTERIFIYVEVVNISGGMDGWMEIYYNGTFVKSSPSFNTGKTYIMDSWEFASLGITNFELLTFKFRTSANIITGNLTLGYWVRRLGYPEPPA